MKHFYSHLIDLDMILGDMEVMALSGSEKQVLAKIAHSTVHHVVIDAMLIHLPKEEHSTFLDNILDDDHAKTWKHVDELIDNAEEKVIAALEQVREILHAEIRSVQKITS